MEEKTQGQTGGRRSAIRIDGKPVREHSDRICRCPEVEAITGIGRSSIYSKMDPKSPYYDETFPKPVKLGPRAVGWWHSKLLNWLESREQRGA